MLYTRLLLIFALFFPFFLNAQDSTAYQWQVTSKKMGDGVYELTFTTQGNSKYDLYGPNEVISEVQSTTLEFDSSVTYKRPFTELGTSTNFISALFDNASFEIYSGPVSFSTTININGKVPAKLLGKLTYTYGRGDEFYPSTPFAFSTDLEGGVASSVRIKIESFDVNKPVNTCGDEDTGGKSLAGIFLLGFLGGFIAPHAFSR
jgi:thiol:disulfide interchange protein DsbD